MDYFNARALGDGFKLVAKLAVIVADEKARSFAKGRGFAQLLGYSGITR